MIIQADKAGLDIIAQLCDVALLHAGIKNLKVVNTVLGSMTEIQPGVKQEIKSNEQQ